MTAMCHALTTSANAPVPLKDVVVIATLHDLLAQVAVRQTYRNDEAQAIEAVYTFPLPMDAVLLGLQVSVDEETRQGIVIETHAAEQRYEEAIEEGNLPVLLEQLEPGLYSANLGNLLPGQQAVIEVRYALVQRWSGNRVRMLLPTTVAPRYGDSPLAPHHAPEVSLVVENRFALTIDVYGALREAQFACPSHELRLEANPTHVRLHFDRDRAVMDRDFVLEITAPQAAKDFALHATDGDQHVVLASFCPFFGGLVRRKSARLVIVADCSGSMAGNAIDQVRQALDAILNRLDPEDRLNLIAFGNSATAMSHRPLTCTPANLAKARKFAANLDANMGGTEIGAALELAYGIAGNAGNADPTDLLLLTDGQVSAWQEVIDNAKTRSCRVFTIGVGTAVTEAFVRGIAEATGGACELVAPLEGMAERVVRHFERIRSPKAQSATISWPAEATDVSPAALGPVFQGDTIVACARIPSHSVGDAIELALKTEDGQIMKSTVKATRYRPSDPEQGPNVLARLAAAHRLAQHTDSTALQTALDYQLVTPQTSMFLVVDQPQINRTGDIPVLRKVPHTLAAGWGGTGNIHFSLSDPMASALRPALRHSMPLVRAMASLDDLDMMFAQEAAPGERGFLEGLRQLLNDDHLTAQRVRDTWQDVGKLAALIPLLTDLEAAGFDGDSSIGIVLLALLRHAGLVGTQSTPEPTMPGFLKEAAKTKAMVTKLCKQARAFTATARAISKQRTMRSIAIDKVPDELDQLDAMADVLQRVEQGAQQVLQRSGGHALATQ